MSFAAMNLLLLLSALLSALTGVGASVRAPEPAQAVAATSIGRVAVALAPARVARRPASALPAIARVAAIGVMEVATVRPAPLWVDRRRE